MSTSLRIATFNLENLDDDAKIEQGQPTLAERIAVMRPQLERLRADVLCLQEVNGQERPGQPRDLLALKELIKGTYLEPFHLVYTKTKDKQEAYDERNLVILSRYPVLATDQIHNTIIKEPPSYKPITEDPPPTQASPRGWERPIFYAKIDIPGGGLHVLNIHLKSKIASTVKGQKEDKKPWKTAKGWAEGIFISSMKRVGQAIETRAKVDELFEADQNARIAVCGDFNGEADDVPVQVICGDARDTENPKHVPFVLIPCERSVPETARFSLIHRGRGYMFDHVLVSRSLLAFYRGAEIHTEVLHDESVAFTYENLAPESDHAPVVAAFELP